MNETITKYEAITNLNELNINELKEECIRFDINFDGFNCDKDQFINALVANGVSMGIIEF